MAEAAATIRADARGNRLPARSAYGDRHARRTQYADTATPMVVLATAHPAKFPGGGRQACGIEPALPAWLGDLMQRQERFTVFHPT